MNIMRHHSLQGVPQYLFNNMGGHAYFIQMGR